MSCVRFKQKQVDGSVKRAAALPDTQSSMERNFKSAGDNLTDSCLLL